MRATKRAGCSQWPRFGTKAAGTRARIAAPSATEVGAAVAGIMDREGSGCATPNEAAIPARPAANISALLMVVFLPIAMAGP